MIADYDSLDFSGPMNQQPHLAVDLGRHGTDTAGEVATDYLVNRDTLSGQPFKVSKLLGFKAGCITGYGSYSSSPFFRLSFNTGQILVCGERV